MDVIRIERKNRTIDLNLSDLRDALSYCPHTGKFTWNKTGKTAGCKKNNPNGNWFQIGFKRERYAGTHIAWLLMTGTYPKHFIGTHDGDALNLRWDNLYEDTTGVIKRSRRIQCNSTTGVPGVTTRNHGEVAQAIIHRDGKQIYLGTRKTIAEAAKLRHNAEALLDYHPR